MGQILLGGRGEPFVVSPVEWPNAEYGTPDILAARVANIIERGYPEKFNADRYGFRLMHHLVAMPWDELAGLYVWLGEPLLPPVFVTLEEYEAVGEPAEVSRLLGHVDDPGLGVDETPVSHPALGQGTKYVRRVKQRRGLFGSTERQEVRWVWRVGGSDVVVTFARDDPAELARILPDVEELVSNARLARPAGPDDEGPA